MSTSISRSPLAVHRVAGVDGEVEDGVLELVGVHPDVPAFVGEAGPDVDPLADRAVDQVEHVLDQLGRRRRFGQQGLGAGEGEQAAGEGGGAGRALHRIVEVELDLAARSAQLAPGEVEPADDDREHVVEVVGDAAGQLADRLHLLDLAKLGLGRGALGRLGLEPLVRLGKLAGAFLDRLIELHRPVGLAVGLAPRADAVRQRRGRRAMASPTAPAPIRTASQPSHSV